MGRFGWTFVGLAIGILASLLFRPSFFGGAMPADHWFAAAFKDIKTALIVFGLGLFGACVGYGVGDAIRKIKGLADRSSDTDR